MIIIRNESLNAKTGQITQKKGHQIDGLRSID